MISKCIRLYEKREDVTLTTYVLEDSPQMLNGKNRPAVLICPGGAYIACSDTEGEPVALAFNAMGYHAFVLRYSVYFEGKQQALVTGEILPKSHCQFPNPVLDIAYSMKYIGNNAAEWHVDMEKIAVCGFSAGAHNSAMYSVYWNKPLITNLFNGDMSNLHPAACILGYAVSDYIRIKSSPAKSEGNPFLDKMKKGLYDLFMTAYTGSKEPSDDFCKKISPALLVDNQTPPMFIWATSEDTMVPVSQSTILATALADHDIPFELHIFEKGAHGLSIATQASSADKTGINPDAARWIDLCSEWLLKRFALDLPNKPAYTDLIS
jgi:acetyl esterase/lipase